MAGCCRPAMLPVEEALKGRLCERPEPDKGRVMAAQTRGGMEMKGKGLIWMLGSGPGSFVGVPVLDLLLVSQFVKHQILC